jgi:UDP-galactopyranose mutase
MNSNIDFLIVGAGLYGATIARLLTDAGFNCLIIDKRDHIAGNIYTERIHGYDKHVYGPHIFHTNDLEVEKFARKYSDWNTYIQATIATDGKKIYHLPFNMNTYYDIFGVYSPMEAKAIIEEEINTYKEQKLKEINNTIIPITNLEEYALLTVGKSIYEKLIKNYTEKQWGKKCSELSQDVIKRLPLRYSFNNNYFNDRFQAIPKDGYTQFVKNIIGDIPYLLNWNFNYNEWHNRCKCIIYCGAVDELLDYQLGELEWRSLKFEDISFKYDGYSGQGMAIKNDVSTSKYTRYVEHMWFMPSKVFVDITSIITKEQPDKWERGKERYYSVNNADTEIKYDAYRDLLMRKMPEVELGGRLGKYKYFDMDDTIYEAMRDAEKLIQIHRK